MDQINFRRDKKILGARAEDTTKDRDVERRMRLAGAKAAATKHRKPISLAGPKFEDD